MILISQICSNIDLPDLQSGRPLWGFVTPYTSFAEGICFLGVECTAGDDTMPKGFQVYDQAYPHFITSTIVHWMPVFCRDSYYRVLVDSFNYCISNKGLLVHGYVIMPTHFHAVLSHPENKLTDTLRDLKKYTSKQISSMLEDDGRHLWLNAMKRASGANAEVRVWDPDYHPEQVHSRPFFEQKLKYMHENPIRAGFISDPCVWKYSSAGFYYQQAESLISITCLEW